MYFENVGDFRKESASYRAMVDGKRGSPPLHLQLHDHLRPEAPAKLQRMGRSTYFRFVKLKIN